MRPRWGRYNLTIFIFYKYITPLGLKRHIKSNAPEGSNVYSKRINKLQRPQRGRTFSNTNISNIIESITYRFSKTPPYHFES